jgi:repressor LexA
MRAFWACVITGIGIGRTSKRKTEKEKNAPSHLKFDTMKGLTKRQREILDFIENYLAEKRHSPSYRDIQRHFGFSSLGSVFNHIKSLKKKGIFSENTKDARSLAVMAHTKAGCIEIPLIGCLRGGKPIETYPQVSMIWLPANMVSSSFPTYLLKIVGSELEEEWIRERDLLMVQSKTHFQDKEMVLAQVGGQTTFVKRGFNEPPYIRLESSHPEVRPLILREDHVHILGVVSGLIRNYVN